jgi:hypothetical protein
MGHYASRTKPCELILNGEYHGVYILMEKIKRDKNRIDINKLDPDEISGDDLTGGYILRVDKIDANDYPAWSSYNGINFQYVDPDGEDLASEQQAYIKNFIYTVGESINSTNFASLTEGYRNYIDIPALADNMLITELGKNIDGYVFSTYMYKDNDSKGGKLMMGPLWDFNLAYGNVDYLTNSQFAPGWTYNDGYRMFWFRRIMQDTHYQYEMRLRWDSLRENVLSNERIEFLIDSMAAGLEEAQVRNYQRWPILGTYVWPNQFVGNTYAEEIGFLKNWITVRANWMDANMPEGTSGEVITDIDDLSEEQSVTVFPNPGKDFFTIEWRNPSHEMSEVRIFNTMGQQVFSILSNNSSVIWRGENPTGTDVKSGMYVLKIKTGPNILLTTKIIKY